MTASLPPGARMSMKSFTALLSCPNSSLTSMRIAWNVLFAGWGPSLLAAAGTAFLMTATSSDVVVIRFSFLASAMNCAILAAHFSSPYSLMIFASCC